jgi:phospholipid/cholesterol/gamma-HCH transport system substrate-binding protein
VVLSVALLAIGATTAAIASSGGGSNPTHITAYFTRTIGLYNGNDVRVLGVKVGKIDSLTVEGPRVKAELTLDGNNKLPAGVKAVVIPPSLVSDRYIELQPAYTTGPVLQNNATLQTSQTAVPLEYDEIFRNLDQLNTALGPFGANKKGALSKLVRVGAKNLQGNGTELNSALGEFSQAITTLSGSRGDLFGTITSLQKFTTTLAKDDGGVRALNSNLAQVGTQLAGDRKDLGAALSNLATALSLVNRFVADNKGKVTNSVHRLTKVSRALESEKEAVTQVVDNAGEAVTNLSLAGDPKVATQQKVNGIGVEPLDTKADLSQPLTATGKGNAACQLFTALGLSQACAITGASRHDTGPGLDLGDLLKAVKK